MRTPPQVVTCAPRCGAAVVAAALCFLSPATVEASTSTVAGFARMTAPLVSHLGGRGPTPPQEQQAPRRPPPVRDPASGVVFSIVGGSVFSGSSAFQTGAALAYFFGAKASVGVEGEGNITFGPGGRVMQFSGSFVAQTGARTSKFVPYVAVGGGLLRASTQLPTATAAALADLGIEVSPTTETAPFFHFGGGLRVYVKPTLAFRADVRFGQVVLDLENLGFSESLFPMRRIAGMLSWDF